MIRQEWTDLARVFTQHTDAQTYEFERTHTFALGRLDEGRQVVAWMLQRHASRRPLRILDVGAGNGGVSLAASNFVDAEVHSLDIVPNPQLVSLRRATNHPIHATVGDGAQLPFADESFDVVLFLDTIEHVPDAAAVGREIVRVLKRGGECMITTPPRLRYFFAREPHYGIPGLLLLPDRAQAFVATKVLRWTKRYEVTHIFWSVEEVVSMFPGVSKHEAFFNRQYPSGRPRLDALWYRYRHLLWDRIVVTK